MLVEPHLSFWQLGGIVIECWFIVLQIDRQILNRPQRRRNLASAWCRGKSEILVHQGRETGAPQFVMAQIQDAQVLEVYEVFRNMLEIIPVDQEFLQASHDRNGWV